MHNLTEKVAYLRGLAEGLDVGKDSKEGKILNGMIDIMHELAHSVSNLDVAHNELEDYVESLDEDLYDLEDEVYDDGPVLLTDGDEDFEDQYVDVECPKCHEIVAFDQEILEDDDIIEVTCPNCDTVVFVNDETLDDISEQTMDI